MEDLFGLVLSWIRFFIATIGIVIITVGAIRSIYHYLFSPKRGSYLNRLRLEFGDSIILGLEFVVAADIVESLAKPGYYELGILAALVLIRTFLSYFLNKELESIAQHGETRHDKKRSD